MITVTFIGATITSALFAYAAIWRPFIRKIKEDRYRDFVERKYCGKKPRLYSATAFGKGWICAGEGWHAFGDTREEAFNQWVREVRADDTAHSADAAFVRYLLRKGIK